MKARRHRKPSGFWIQGTPTVVGPETHDLWLARVREARAADELTDKAYSVACATAKMVVRDGKPAASRKAIAARVRKGGVRCSVKTVERAHKDLHAAGLLRWQAEYAIDGRDGRPRRAANVYELLLPATKPVYLTRQVRAVIRPHAYERQAGAVRVREASLPLFLSLAELTARREAAFNADWQAARKARCLMIR